MSAEGTAVTDRTSYSELSTLASCEMKWYLRYQERLEVSDESEALQLGRLLDGGCASLSLCEEWDPWLRGAVALPGTDSSKIVFEDCEDPVPRAAWLLARYEDHWGGYVDPSTLPYDWTVFAQQLDVVVEIPGTEVQHRAIVDEVWCDANGSFWMVERKSYGRRSRIETVAVDPQLTLNMWALSEHLGEPVVGIVFDGIYTYRWKAERPTQKIVMDELVRGYYGPNWDTATALELREEARRIIENHPGVERPTYESFDRLFLDRTDEHVNAALEEVRAGIARRQDLRNGAVPLRNIGSGCGYCAAKSTCWERLMFNDELEVIGD